jgi:hypothetical protein
MRAIIAYVQGLQFPRIYVFSPDQRIEAYARLRRAYGADLLDYDEVDYDDQDRTLVCRCIVSHHS